jgi:hypothetical protein
LARGFEIGGISTRNDDACAFPQKMPRGLKADAGRAASDERTLSF